MVVLKKWKWKCKNRNVLMYCDNKVTVEVVNSGKANNKFAQSCLREICWIIAEVHVWVKVKFSQDPATRLQIVSQDGARGHTIEKDFTRTYKGLKLKKYKSIEKTSVLRMIGKFCLLFLQDSSC